MQPGGSDPRVAVVAQVGVLSVVVLLVTHVGLTAYFDRMTMAEQYKKIGSLKPDALTSLRDDEKQRLTTGSMPVDRAMQQLVAKGRMGAGPEVVPSASRDVAPMQGWMQMPRDVPPIMMAPEPSAAPSASTAPSSAPSAAPAPSASAAPPRHP